MLLVGGRKTSNTNDLTSRDNQTGTDPPGHESSIQKLTPTPQEACEKLDLKDPLPRSPKKENRIIMQPSRRHKFTSSTRRVVSPRAEGEESLVILDACDVMVQTIFSHDIPPRGRGRRWPLPPLYWKSRKGASLTLLVLITTTSLRVNTRIFVVQQAPPSSPILPIFLQNDITEV